MKKGVLTILSLAMFIIVIDTTIMNVSISALVEDLNTTVSGIQSAISIYALVMASFILIGGKLADIIGKKRTFTIGLILFGIGTFTASISTSLAMLIVGWSVIEGLGSALMMPNIQTILRDTYKDKELPMSYGLIGAVGAVGAALGPIVGGILTTYFTWRYAFLMEVAIVVAILLFSGLIKKDILPKIKPSFDFKGAFLSVLGLSSIVFSILLISTYGIWTAKQPFMIGDYTFAPFGLSIVPFMMFFGLMVIWGFLRYEAKLEANKESGLLKPSILKIGDFKSGILVRFIQMMITAGALYVFPLYMQISMGLNAIDTGLKLMPFSLSLLVAAIVGSKLSAKFSAKKLIQVGLIGAMFGIFLMLLSLSGTITLSPGVSSSIFGIGIGLIASQIVNLILSSVKIKQTAEAAGVSGTFEQLGNSIGVALLGTILVVVLSANVKNGVNASTVLTSEEKVSITEAIGTDVELLSTSSLENALEEYNLDSDVQDELIAINQQSLNEAFMSALVFMLFLTIAGLFSSARLPDKKLVS